MYVCVYIQFHGMGAYVCIFNVLNKFFVSRFFQFQLHCRMGMTSVVSNVQMYVHIFMLMD